MFRKIFFWTHFSLGLAAGLLIAILAASGLVLSFEGIGVGWAERSASHLGAVPEGAVRLSLNELAAKVAAARPDLKVNAFSIQNDPRATVKLQVGRDQAVYVDPYTGVITGEAATGVANFFHGVEDLHRFFLMQGAARGAAHQVKFAVNLAFLVLLLTGLVLWWPRNKAKAVFWPKAGLNGQAKRLNRHQAYGLLAWPFIFIIVFTGLMMSYDWGKALPYRLAGEAPPQRPGPPPGPEKPREQERPLRKEEAKPQAEAAPLDLDAQFRAAIAQAPRWVTISGRPSRSGQGGANLTVVYADARIPQGRGGLRLDEDASVKAWEPFEGLSAGRQAEQYARWSHTGEAFGPVGQILAALACCAILILFWIGWAMALRRLSKPSSTEL